MLVAARCKESGWKTRTGSLPRRRVRSRKKHLPTTRVSVIVLSSDDKSILLVQHRKRSKHYWVLPGGRLEYGESLFECARREIREETGLEVEAEKPIFLSEAISPDRAHHIVNIFIKARQVGGKMKLGDEAVLSDVAFFPIGDLRQIGLFPPVHEDLLKAIENGFKDDIKYLGNIWM